MLSSPFLPFPSDAHLDWLVAVGGKVLSLRAGAAQAAQQHKLTHDTANPRQHDQSSPPLSCIQGCMPQAAPLACAHLQTNEQTAPQAHGNSDKHVPAEGVERELSTWYTNFCSELCEMLCLRNPGPCTLEASAPQPLMQQSLSPKPALSWGSVVLSASLSPGTHQFLTILVSKGVSILIEGTGKVNSAGRAHMARPYTT